MSLVARLAALVDAGQLTAEDVLHYANYPDRLLSAEERRDLGSLVADMTTLVPRGRSDGAEFVSNDAGNAEHEARFAAGLVRKGTLGFASESDMSVDWEGAYFSIYHPAELNPRLRLFANQLNSKVSLVRPTTQRNQSVPMFLTPGIDRDPANTRLNGQLKQLSDRQAYASQLIAQRRQELARLTSDPRKLASYPDGQQKVAALQAEIKYLEGQIAAADVQRRLLYGTNNSYQDPSALEAPLTEATSRNGTAGRLPASGDAGEEEEEVDAEKPNKGESIDPPKQGAAPPEQKRIGATEAPKQLPQPSVPQLPQPGGARAAISDSAGGGSGGGQQVGQLSLPVVEEKDQSHRANGSLTSDIESLLGSYDSAAFAGFLKHANDSMGTANMTGGPARTIGMANQSYTGGLNLDLAQLGQFVQEEKQQRNNGFDQQSSRLGMENGSVAVGALALGGPMQVTPMAAVNYQSFLLNASAGANSFGGAIAGGPDTFGAIAPTAFQEPFNDMSMLTSIASSEQAEFKELMRVPQELVRQVQTSRPERRAGLLRFVLNAMMVQGSMSQGKRDVLMSDPLIAGAYQAHLPSAPSINLQAVNPSQGYSGRKRVAARVGRGRGRGFSKGIRGRGPASKRVRRH